MVTSSGHLYLSLEVCQDLIDVFNKVKKLTQSQQILLDKIKTSMSSKRTTSYSRNKYKHYETKEELKIWESPEQILELMIGTELLKET